MTAESASKSPFVTRDALTALALGVLAAVSYVPALSGGFVWDDVVFSEEPVIHAVSGLKSIWFSPTDIRNEGHYWPLVYTSFWLEHKLWGLAPVGYHAVNVLLHLLNCLLLWRLMVRLAVPGAVLIAAVFAVHPLHVESVAWIIERKDVLSALFYLSAVLTWVRFAETPGPGRYALALALFTAGLLSKSVVVTLPATLLIWHWWRYGRVTRIDLLRLAPFAAVAVAITAGDLSLYALREPLELGYTLAERALIAARALWFYAGKLLWPVDLAVIYPLWEIDAGAPLAWAYVAAAVGLAAGLWLARHRIGRGPLAGVLYFAVTLGPVLGFVDYGYMQFSFVADRFQYLAGIGVLAVLIGGAAHGVGKLPGGYRRGALVVAAFVVVVLGALTWRQAGIYRDQLSLFTHIVAHNPEARDAHLNLGHALLKAGRYEEALAAARIAVEQRPDFAYAHHLVGLALMNLQQFEAAVAPLRQARSLEGEATAIRIDGEAADAVRQGRELDPKHKIAMQHGAEWLRMQGAYDVAVLVYEMVLEHDRRYAPAYAGLGDTLFRMERYEDAIEALGTALEIRPESSFAGRLHVLMGRAQRELGRLDAAEAHFRRAMEIDPDTTAALFGLAAVLHAQQRHDEALSMYREMLDINPEFAPAYAGLGETLFLMERYEESLEALRRALSEQPQTASWHNLAGRAAEALDRQESAAEHYENAVRLNPRDTSSIERLARVRLDQEQYQAALEWYQVMLDINPDAAQTHVNAGVTLYYLGRTEDALRSFERAVEIDPDLEAARSGLEQLRTQAHRERQ